MNELETANAIHSADAQHPVAKALAMLIRLAGPRNVTDHQQLVLENGRAFIGVKRPRGFHQMAPGSCFLNAGLLASEERGRYCEGFAVCAGDGPAIFHHAWLTVGGDTAIDVTLPNAADFLYFGIEFPHRHFMDLIREHWRGGYSTPLLTRDPGMTTLT